MPRKVFLPNFMQRNHQKKSLLRFRRFYLHRSESSILFSPFFGYMPVFIPTHCWIGWSVVVSHVLHARLSFYFQNLEAFHSLQNNSFCGCKGIVIIPKWLFFTVVSVSLLQHLFFFPFIYIKIIFWTITSYYENEMVPIKWLSLRQTLSSPRWNCIEKQFTILNLCQTFTCVCSLTLVL